MKEIVVKFNDEQLNIIDEGINKNILVQAAAGSGKTTVLTERIVRKLLGENTDGKEISLTNILVMTFTKKATAEMKTRIKQKLEEKFGEGNNVKKLIRESAIIQNVNISTIDAFCKRILEENYTALTEDNSLYYDFDLTYRIADDKEMAVLWDDVIDEFFESNYMNKKYKILFDTYIDKTDESRIKSLLIKGLNFLSSITWPDEYLSRQIMDFESVSKKAYDEYITKCIDDLISLKNDVDNFLEEAIIMQNYYTESLAGGINDKGNKLTDKGKESLQNGIEYSSYYIGILREYADLKFLTKDKDERFIIDKKIYKEIFEKFSKFLATKPVFPVVSYIVGVEKEKLDEFKDKYKKISESLDLILKVYNVINFSDNRVYNDSDKVFLEFLREFYLKIVAEKRKRNLYEISDYSRMVLDILYDKVIDKSGHIDRVISKKAQEIGNRYELIFIDEYQDTNFIQEKILAAISDNFNKGNVFMVGDVKQSIYGFRNAEPSIFVNKYNDFESGKGGINKTLSTNYRSTKEIIGYVNDLFSKSMTTDFGSIDYNKDNALGIRDEEIDREILEDNKVEVHVVYKKDDLKDDYTPLDYEADFVASEIKRLVEEKKCKYSDIVILLRTIKYKAKSFEEALKRHKIPSYAEQRTGFFEKLEIKLMADILSIIDNPLQNVPFTAVIKSNIFRFDNDELSFIKLMSEDEYLYDSCVYIDKLIDENVGIEDVYKKAKLENKIKEYGIDREGFSAKLKKFLNALCDLQFKSRYFNISGMIEYIYSSLNIKEIVSAMSDGRQRKANLETLYDLAVKFENSSYCSLFNFNRYIKKISDVAIDQGQAKIYDENSDTVRIMTLHTSKGLQFNTVFLCGCNAEYNLSDSASTNDVQFDQEYGVALDYFDDKDRYISNTAKKLLIASKKEKETKLEELRMLYVALTRAEKKLYITGVASKKGSKGFSYKTLSNFIESKNSGNQFKIDMDKCNSYLEVVLSNYPINDEKYCKFEAHEWEISDAIEENYDMPIEEVSKSVRNEKEVIANNALYFESVKDSNIEKNLYDNYYYVDYQRLKPKFSVSALKQMNKERVLSKVYESEDKNVGVDDVLVDKKNDDREIVNGAEIGNAYHRFMQFYDYNKNEYVCEKEKNSTVNEVVDKGKIEAFLNTSVGREMSEAYKSNRLYREQKFMKLYSQSEINNYLSYENEKIFDIKKEILDDKTIIIQGIIDAYYIKKDSEGNEYIVLLDYKTDMITKNVEKEKMKNILKDRYKLQLDIYADVLKEITGMEVKERYLYSFATNDVVAV